MNYTATQFAEPTETRPAPVLAISRAAAGITLHTLQLDGLHELGTFRSVSDAWAAIDAVDAPAV